MMTRTKFWNARGWNRNGYKAIGVHPATDVLGGLWVHAGGVIRVDWVSELNGHSRVC